MINIDAQTHKRGVYPERRASNHLDVSKISNHSRNTPVQTSHQQTLRQQNLRPNEFRPKITQQIKSTQNINLNVSKMADKNKNFSSATDKLQLGNLQKQLTAL